MNELTKVDQQAKSEVTTTMESLGNIKEFLSQALIDGQDFGMFGKAKKNTLLKSGAEKIQFYLRLRPKYTLMKEHLKDDFVLYQYKCEIFSIKSGEQLGEAIGSCNSTEAQYDYEKNKARLINTIDKIAQKRAYVSAILNSGGGVVSERFTCDMEDQEEEVKTPAPKITDSVKPNIVINQCSNCKSAISDKVKSFSIDKYGKALCMDCQKNNVSPKVVKLSDNLNNTQTEFVDDSLE